MKLLDVGSIVIVSIVIAACVAGIISRCFLGNDNPIEQASEELIYQETGERVDLSPEVDQALRFPLSVAHQS